jgi:DNA-binding NarL/FixJ family response regulator
VIRVVIADDQQMLRAGLRMVIETEPVMNVVGDAGDGVEAVSVVRRLQPDVVLMDIAMPRQDGLAATRTLLASPGAPRVIMLTTFDTGENLYNALRAGASGSRGHRLTVSRRTVGPARPGGCAGARRRGR